MESNKYTSDEIRLLRSWKDKVAGSRWLHFRSMHFYKKINSRFVYISIVLSTVAGAGGFTTAGGSSSSSNTNNFLDTIQKYSGYMIGAINVVIGLINSFQRFGKAAEKCEMHSSATMGYAMVYRFLDTELKLSDHHRRDDLIMYTRQEIDRLATTSPDIPECVIREFNRLFPDLPNKPDVCGALAEPSTPKIPRMESLLKESSAVGDLKEQERVLLQSLTNVKVEDN